MPTNLEFIKSASTSSTSIFTVTDCFNANYDIYKIYIYLWLQLHVIYCPN